MCLLFALVVIVYLHICHKRENNRCIQLSVKPESAAKANRMDGSHLNSVKWQQRYYWRTRNVKLKHCAYFFYKTLVNNLFCPPVPIALCRHQWWMNQNHSHGKNLSANQWVITSMQNDVKRMWVGGSRNSGEKKSVLANKIDYGLTLIYSDLNK